MSPVDRDESSGDAFGDLGRPLTRKELRAREKLLATQSQDAVPPQAYVEDPPSRPLPEVPAPPVESPQVPPAPPEPPFVQDEPTYHPEPVHQEPVPVHPEPVHDEPLHHEERHDLVTVGEFPAAHSASHFTQLSEPVPDHGGQGHHEFDDRDEADAHHVHDEALDGHHHVDEQALHLDQHGHPLDEHVHHLDEHAHGHDHHLDEHGHPLFADAPAVKKGPSKKVRRRRRFLALLLTLAVFVTALVVGAQFLKPLLGMDKVADFPGPGTGQVSVTVQPGEGVRSVATRLESEKVVANADTFASAFEADGGTLSPGDFVFRQQMKNTDAVAILVGKDQGKVMYFALSAGLRIDESLAAIAKGSGIPESDLKALSDSPAQFGVSAKAKNLEGFLAPGEYRFPLGTTAKEIVQKLVSTTVDELKAQGVTDPDKQYDVVTVASIVQAEGGQAEYGDVAGAIYNRLKPDNTETNGLIQSDATVTYGLGIKSFHISEEQKADKSNPYNTYAKIGLPAGPIGSPGKTAIDAAAKPKPNDYLYWVTINLDTKETKFSKTLAEHSVYVEQYNEWCAANAGRCV
ncbi:endolytic transglycosylase MltG [Arthrobacter sp.]|uniref:endolytic transglycosylase MltG n=1 Tax=Arthrobacter sp. TaxID=1667 RepID=UPI002811D0B9|nr:endolytic transglycosylase MltG [Arthrobacter sp.]